MFENDVTMLGITNRLDDGGFLQVWTDISEMKRKERQALRRAKRASTNLGTEKDSKMHDINKPITLEDLTNPEK